MKKYVLRHLLLIAMPFFVQAQSLQKQTDVLVIGGTTGGIAAALQSARNKVRTLVVEQTHWLGGMLTAAGVSCTDGNHQLQGGIWKEFNDALQTHYKGKSLATGWVSNTCFEPRVGDSIFKAWAKNEKDLSVMYNWYFHDIIRNKNKVVGAIFINKKKQLLKVTAKIVIDATDLGDAFAAAGCNYDLGTEDSTQSNEKIAPGKSSVIQDLTWAATLQDFGAGADKTIPRPFNYDSTKYFCSTTEAPCFKKSYDGDSKKVLNYGKLPVTNTRTKYMLNWPAFGNDYYLNVVETKPILREEKYAAAKNHTLGFVYFLQTQLGMKHIGLADEFGTKDKLALMPYNREGRRVRGLVRFNINHILQPYNYTLYRTGIAVGDYPVDHHHAQYPGKVPPIPFPKIPAYNIPIGALIPKDVDGLIVCEKGISVSNIINGTTRLQPVVLLTGQAAGQIAATCIKEKIQPREINVNALQAKLVMKYKCFVMPFADVDATSLFFLTAQHIGILGVIKGECKSEGWANKMYFRPDSLMKENELKTGINEMLGAKVLQLTSNDSISITNGVIKQIVTTVNTYICKKLSLPENQYAIVYMNIPDETLLTRKLVAHHLSYAITWDRIKIDIYGNTVFKK